MTFGGYQPESERLREALCTMGNGYLAVRGAAPECGPGEFHYPGTYVAGIYNRLTDTVAGVTIDNESMVNLPNWLALAFRIDGGPWFDIDDVDVSSYLVTLDLRRAVLSREFLFTDADGRSTRVRQRRFVAMHQPHVAALQTTVEALNWSGQLEFRSLVDGAVTNQGSIATATWRHGTSRSSASTNCHRTRCCSPQKPSSRESSSPLRCATGLPTAAHPPTAPR